MGVHSELYGRIFEDEQAIFGINICGLDGRTGLVKLRGMEDSDASWRLHITPICCHTCSALYQQCRTVSAPLKTVAGKTSVL